MKINTDWVAEYEAKRTIMQERGFSEVSTKEFYRDLFPEGSLQEEEGDGKGNMILTQVRKGLTSKGKRQKSKRWIIGEDLEGLQNVVNDPFPLIAPVSFFGRRARGHSAHELYALGIDVDYVERGHLINLLGQFRHGIQLTPSYVVSSGRGLHLYYFLQEPYPLYSWEPWRLQYASAIKRDLIRRLWNDTSSQNGEETDKDIAGCLQGFRAVGGLSKLGFGYPVRAWKVSGNRYTLEQIRDAIPDCTAVEERPEPRNTVPLDIARRLWPDWYQRRIVNQEPPKPPRENFFLQDRRLYDWWKREKMEKEVRSGGRFFSLVSLIAFGLKCGIPDEEIRSDAWSFLDRYEKLTEDPSNHFLGSDVEDALKMLEPENRDMVRKLSRQWIADHSRVAITPQIRRNGRKQAEHLAGIRAAQAAYDKLHGTSWHGRKSKEPLVRAWREEHPEGTIKDCVYDLGISQATVYRHWEPKQEREQEVKTASPASDFPFTSFAELNVYLDTLTQEELQAFYELNKDLIDSLTRGGGALEGH